MRVAEQHRAISEPVGVAVDVPLARSNVPVHEDEKGLEHAGAVSVSAPDQFALLREQLAGARGDPCTPGPLTRPAEASIELSMKLATMGRWPPSRLVSANQSGSR